MWLIKINAINKLWKYSDSTYEFIRIVNTSIIFTDLIPYNKEVIMHEIREY